MGEKRVPMQVRLPGWAVEFIEETAKAEGATKTDVVVQALADMRRQRLEARLAQGYASLGEEHLREVEAMLPVAAEVLEES